MVGRFKNPKSGGLITKLGKRGGGLVKREEGTFRIRKQETPEVQRRKEGGWNRRLGDLGLKEQNHAR